MKDRVFRFGLRLTRLTESIAAVLLVAVLLMNLGQVFWRYALVDPLSWSEESMRYSTVWMVFLAGSAALFRGEHMSVDIFADLRAPRLRRAIRLTVLGLIALFCLILIWEGMPAAILNIRQMSPAMQIPMIIPYIAVPVGGLLMLIKVLCLMALPEAYMLREMREENEP